MKRLLENRIHWHWGRIVSLGVVIAALILLIACWPSRLSLPPLPSSIESMEGYGSLRITGSQGTSKIRFSFLFFLPHQGRIESFNFLGRSIYYILIDREKSFFVLPSKKVYWQGNVEEIISKTLGFSLDQYEMISILSGEWNGKEISLEVRGDPEKWSFKRDEGGRIVRGQRGDLSFEIEEFFKDSRFARLLLFHHPWIEGRLKILQIDFNQPKKPAAFSRRFLEEYELKTWAEIEKLLGNEN